MRSTSDEKLRSRPPSLPRPSTAKPVSGAPLHRRAQSACQPLSTSCRQTSASALNSRVVSAGDTTPATSRKARRSNSRRCSRRSAMKRASNDSSPPRRTCNSARMRRGPRSDTVISGRASQVSNSGSRRIFSTETGDTASRWTSASGPSRKVCRTRANSSDGWPAADQASASASSAAAARAGSGDAPTCAGRSRVIASTRRNRAGARWLARAAGAHRASGGRVPRG